MMVAVLVGFMISVVVGVGIIPVVLEGLSPTVTDNATGVVDGTAGSSAFVEILPFVVCALILITGVFWITSNSDLKISSTRKAGLRPLLSSAGRAVMWLFGRRKHRK